MVRVAQVVRGVSGVRGVKGVREVREVRVVTCSGGQVVRWYSVKGITDPRIECFHHKLIKFSFRI